MSTRDITRRRFIEGSVCAGAAVALTSAAIGAGSDTRTAFAAQNKSSIGNIPQTEQIPVLCEGCSNNCGCYSYNVNGEFNQMFPDGNNPASKGRFCARGFSYTQSAFSDDAITTPLKRLPSGRYDEISWDQALQEIAIALDAIYQSYGTDALAMAYTPSPVNSFYGPRLMHALGSGNVFLDDVVYNSSKAAGFTQVIGTPTYTPDLGGSNLVLLIDTSYNDVERPNLIHGLGYAMMSGKSLISIDSRIGKVSNLAGTWISVRPGTTLALLLAVCNTIIREGRYDKEFVAQNSVGFDEWASAIADATPEWAAEICGVTATEIEELAGNIINAAPSVAIQYGNADGGTGTYANSGETARVVCLLNTLIGAWNQPGGALLPFDWTDKTATEIFDVIAPTAMPIESVFASDTYPLATKEAGAMALLMERLATHQIKGLITLDANIAADYASVEGLDGFLRDLNLFVAITRERNETAELADYILPECSYLECASLPCLMNGQAPAVSIKNQAIHRRNAETLSADEIVRAIGLSLGLDRELDLDINDVSAIQLSTLGQTLDSLQSSGTITLINNEVSRMNSWNTPTGKIQFTSEACKAAGLNACPVWVEPYTSDTPEEEPGSVALRLITAEQTVVGPDSANIPRLMDIAEKYSLYNAWINTETAELLGIETGDNIVISGTRGSDIIPVKVTGCLNPDAIYIPRFFGSTAKGLHTAAGVGINPMIFVDAQAEAGYGSVCNQGACVLVQKAGE